jgi:hypothetical protein
MSRGKLTWPQIEALAALYHCKVVDGFVGTSTFVKYEDKREDIGAYYECKEWTRDQWRTTFERVAYDV